MMLLDFGVQIYNDFSGTDTKLVLKYDILADFKFNYLSISVLKTAPKLTIYNSKPHILLLAKYEACSVFKKVLSTPPWKSGGLNLLIRIVLDEVAIGLNIGNDMA